ncbi:MAG: tetratricopeptide repeat protein [Bacteroidales bacterium]|nr:tetratricopeptide repeat protein [Bacteroidales bacterium]
MPDVEQLFAVAAGRHQAGDRDAAERMYRELLTQFPQHAASWCNLGVLLVQAGQPDAAAECYVRALAVVPNHPDAHFNLGNLYRRAGRFPEAVAEFRACLAARSSHSGALFNLGLCLSALEDLPAATACFREAVRLEPQNADAYLRLGDCLLRGGKLIEAITTFRAAVERKPSDPRTHYNLGLALANAGQTLPAQESLTHALHLKPDYAEAHNALGLTLETLHRKDDAFFHYQQAVQCRPDFADAWSNLGTNLGEQGRSEESISCLRHSLSIRPNAVPVHSNLLLQLNYSSQLTPEQVFAEHRAWAERHAGPTPEPLPIPTPHDAQRRLRVGYLSADYRAHTVSGFLELLLTHHDRGQVELFAYANVLRPDETTEQLRKLADQWRPIVGMSDAAVAEQIREDRIDILVDLGGHTASNRLLVLARRPAPVQATLFGYPNTTGMPAVDFRITDPISDPVSGPVTPSCETPLRLPEVAWVYRPPDSAPAPGPLPALSQRVFTLGCLNNAAKLSDACLTSWIEILRAVPGTRLVLLAGQAQMGAKRLLERVTQAGVLRDRVELLPRLPPEQYFARHQQFDLYLDPFPYNGGVTTCDALWMGVPVLTVRGTSYVSRQGVGLMTRIGLPGCIAESPAQLVGMVQEWSHRRPELAEIRRELRGRMAASVICDAPRYLRHLESAYRQVWQERLPR